MREKHINRGTCSRSVSFDIDSSHTVTNIVFEGGCNGNLKGISSLCDGMKAEDIIEKCANIRCGMKRTSCPDQLADALRETLDNER